MISGSIVQVPQALISFLQHQESSGSLPLAAAFLLQKIGPEDITVGTNPRYHNGSRRRKYRARFKAMGAPCGICGGRLGEIHYDEPSDAQHPLSFVIDEKIPISRYKEFGYESREAAANDWGNLQAAHYCCNAAKSNKLITNAVVKSINKAIKHSDNW
ncbi:MAG: hypothetical protein J6U56_05495 [Spirochaetia bacterium]|nr:hypothetical protein [Spirochaetia bacterium]